MHEILNLNKKLLQNADKDSNGDKINIVKKRLITVQTVYVKC